MIYKNSIRVFFSNFNLVWKMILYFLIISAVCFGALILFLNPVIKLINEAGFFEELLDLYSDFLTSLNLIVSLERLSKIFENMFDFFVSNFNSIWWNIVGAGVILFFLNSFLFNLSNMAVSQSLHFYIGSLTRQGFWSSYSENFAKNLRSQFAYFFVTLPLNALYLFLFILSLKLFGIHWLLNILAVFIIVLGFVVLLAFKWVMFSTWIPTMVVMNYGVWKSLRYSIKSVFKRFGRVFSNAIGMVFTLVIINVASGLFTFMAGLVLSVPISFLLYNAFGMVLVYDGQGMRYYVDIYNVVTPSKKEITDKLKEMKYII